MYKAEYADNIKSIKNIKRYLLGVNRVQFNSKYNENKLSKSEQQNKINYSFSIPQ